MVCGTVLIAAGVAALISSGLGAGAIDALVAGVNLKTGVPMGLLSFLMGSVLVTVAWIAGIRPGIGTVASMVLFAPTFELFLSLPPHDLGAPPSVAVAVAEWVAGAVLIAAGSALMIAANLGVGGYDAVTLAIAKRTGLSIPKSRLPPRQTRCLMVDGGTQVASCE